MNYILFDDHTRVGLFPLTFTRPVAEIRIGILTIREKWERLLSAGTSIFSEKYLLEKFPLTVADENILINGSVVPDEALVEAIKRLKIGQKLMKGNKIIALHISGKELEEATKKGIAIEALRFEEVPFDHSFFHIEHVWDIFKSNGLAIERDFKLLTHGRKSASLSGTNQLLGDGLFIEEGAKVECAMINTLTGPVYIGKGAEVMEGTVIRGPFALCEGAVLKMGAKIYGPTTIGPYSKAGGEINNSVISGYSNKGHDGFMGNSVIGEWCNIGADTNTSNLKNNYGEVKLWGYSTEQFGSTGQQFCGLIMGDHSKCGINTMFNTGTLVGVSCNIFGAGFPRKYIPSFSWGGAAGFREYDFGKACEVAEIVMERRNKTFNETEKKVLKTVFELTASFRRW